MTDRTPEILLIHARSVLTLRHIPDNLLDERCSSILSSTIHAQPRMCWHNAMDALPLIPGARYVEGLVAMATFPEALEHGWVELVKPRRIIDPTPRFCSGQAGALAYFAGQRWTREQVVAIMRQYPDGVTLPLSNHHVREHGRIPDHVPERALLGWRSAIRACHAYRMQAWCTSGSCVDDAVEREQASLDIALSGWSRGTKQQLASFRTRLAAS